MRYINSHLTLTLTLTGPLSNTMLLGIARVSPSNGISFCPVALAGCMSVTDGHTDGQTMLLLHLSQYTALLLSAMPPDNNNVNL